MIIVIDVILYISTITYMDLNVTFKYRYHSIVTVSDLIFFNVCPSIFLLCSLSVTLPPIMSFPLSINSLQPKPFRRSLVLPRWLWPAAAGVASLACLAVLPVLSVSQWAAQLCGRRRAAGAGPPYPAAAAPPVSASWVRVSQTPVLLLRMVSAKR